MSVKTKTQGIFKSFAKVVLGIFIFALIVGIIGLTIALILQTREVNRLKNLYKQAESNLNSDLEESQATVENLEKSFETMKKENEQLKGENQDLKEELSKQEIEGYGRISGEILPFIVGDENFNQYQLVCAENVNNNKVKYCVTAQASRKEYILNVPSGSYYVFSTIDTTNEALKGYRAYYTEYIKCTVEKEASQCNPTDLAKPIKIDVKSGDLIENIDPVDWKKI